MPDRRRLAALVAAALVCAQAAAASANTRRRTHLVTTASVDASARARTGATSSPSTSERVPVDLKAPEPAQLAPSQLVTAPPPPPSIERSRRWGLFAGGLTLFSAGYALDIGLTYGVGHQPSTTSLIPLVGPLIQLADDWSMVPQAQTGNSQIDTQANAQIAQVNHTIQIVAYAVLAVDFAFQLAGLTMAIVGVATHRDVVRPYASRPARTAWSFTGNGLAVRF
jgi:hypothetical protein